MVEVGKCVSDGAVDVVGAAKASDMSERVVGEISSREVREIAAVEKSDMTLLYEHN